MIMQLHMMMQVLRYAQGMPPSDAALGLRERKNRRTRRAIVQATAELTIEGGYAAATIPRIAERADVAPRTVSTLVPGQGRHPVRPSRRHDRPGDRAPADGTGGRRRPDPGLDHRRGGSRPARPRDLPAARGSDRARRRPAWQGAPAPREGPVGDRSGGRPGHRCRSGGRRPAGLRRCGDGRAVHAPLDRPRGARRRARATSGRCRVPQGRPCGPHLDSLRTRGPGNQSHRDLSRAGLSLISLRAVGPAVNSRRDPTRERGR